MKTTGLTLLAFSLLTFAATGCADIEDIDGHSYGDAGDMGDYGDEEDGEDAGGEGGQDDDGREPGDGDGDGDGDDDGRDPGDGDGDGDSGDGDGDGDSGDGDGDGDATCAPLETDLFAGQHIDAGSVFVYAADDKLVVEIEASAPWMLNAAHVYAGADEVDDKVPGLYPYAEEFDAPTDAFAFEIPLDELEVGCADVLNIAVHTELLRIEDGEVVQEETGWGFGPEEFEKAWGWHFDYELCCEPSSGL